jgi:hypothetical protein
MKKLLISAFVMLALTVAAFTASTIAYFTDGEDDRLIISADGANLSGKIIEYTVLEEGTEAVLGPTNIRIVPGGTVKKTVSVENTGSMDMYLRIAIDKVFALSEANAGKPTDPELVQLEINDEYWELRDGFYYYKNVLSDGDTTEPLFETVHFSSKMNNTYTNSTITLTVRAYATQIPAEATTVFDVQSWPSVE